MRFNPKSLLLGLVYVLLAVFVWWNREVIFGYPSGLGEDPTALREALAARLPLVDLSQFTTGEVLLGFLGLLTLLYVLFAAGVRTSSLVELRRYAKEVEAARKLADEAEASRISGLHAHLDGLVASLREEALALAASVASFSASALMALKECINRAFESPLAEGILFERRELHARFATPDAHEGMRAFMEKRRPIFEHQ